MIIVTNRRVAGFSPRWRSFRGFTLLFDNPGNSLTDWQGFQLVACDPALEFYRALHGGLQEIGIDMLIETYLFCPLAPVSYHVTAWDCVNDGNLARLHAQYQPQLAELLAELPASLAKPNACIQVPLASELITQQAWGIRFRFDRLVKWGNIALVALLRPADEEAARCLQSFTAARNHLNTSFCEVFGVSASESYRPHVTVGYFANTQLAQLSTPCVDGWSAILAAHLGDLTLTFDRVSLYGFTDIETFFRNPA
jgi:hypothetical protein